MEIIGRAAELAKLRAWLHSQTQNRKAVLVIEGEPGIGKTTLWAEAVDSAFRAGKSDRAARGVASTTHRVLGVIIAP